MLGDWLQGQGDPRGELIALELAGKDKQARALIQKQADYFLGGLADHQQTHDGNDQPAFEWRYGAPEINEDRTGRIVLALVGSRPGVAQTEHVGAPVILGATSFPDPVSPSMSLSVFVPPAQVLAATQLLAKPLSACGLIPRFDDMAAAFDRMAETLGSAEKRIIKLESVVEEGRDDFRELRGGGHQRSAKRAATPSG